MNVRADGGRDGQVTIRFDSPASAATVRDWFAERLPKAGYRVRPDPNGITGSTPDDKPFRLAIDGAGEKARGTITLG